MDMECRPREPAIVMAEADETVLAALAELGTRMVEQEETLEQLRGLCLSLETSQAGLRRHFEHLVNQSEARYFDASDGGSASCTTVAHIWDTLEPRGPGPSAPYLDFLREVWLSSVLADTCFGFMDARAAYSFGATSRAPFECRRGLIRSPALRAKDWKGAVSFSSSMPHGGQDDSRPHDGHDSFENGSPMASGVPLSNDSDPWHLRKAQAPTRRRAICARDQRVFVRGNRTKYDVEKASNRVRQQSSERPIFQARKDLVSTMGAAPRSTEAAVRRRLSRSPSCPARASKQR